MLILNLSNITGDLPKEVGKYLKCPATIHGKNIGNCKFPFTWRKKQYHTCIYGGREGKMCKVSNSTFGHCSKDPKYTEACGLGKCFVMFVSNSSTECRSIINKNVYI